MATQMSKKRKFVANGVFFYELNEVLMRELAEDGYSGVKVRVNNVLTEIIIRATRTQNVGELTPLVQKRFKFLENSTELYAERVNNRGLCGIAQPESLCYKLLRGLAVCKPFNVKDFILNTYSWLRKLTAQCAKSMKFKDGYMTVKEYVDSALRHVFLR